MVRLQVILNEQKATQVKETAKQQNRSISNFLAHLIGKALEDNFHAKEQ